MLIKNETRTEIEKKNFRKLRRRLEIIEQILAFFLVYFFYEGTYRKKHIENSVEQLLRGCGQKWCTMPNSLALYAVYAVNGSYGRFR